MNWTKLSEEVPNFSHLSPTEMPLLGTIRESTSGCELHLKYLTGDSGHRTWRSDRDAESVEFSENPFRVIAVVTRAENDCGRVTERHYATAIDAFLTARAPNIATKETWKVIMERALAAILAGERAVSGK